jgi:starch synthase
MFVVMVSSECAPVAKTGGLGDVVEGLSHELSLRGHEVEIILPLYDCMRYDRIRGLTLAYGDLSVPFHGTAIPCDVHSGFVDGAKCFFIEPHSPQNFFKRGVYYGQNDDAERFAFFSRAALEFLLKSGRRPDIIHCHDWQTGLVPVLLYEVYQHLGMNRSRVCYTLHNVKYQGVCGEQVLRQVGLDPGAMMSPDRLLDHTHRGAVNLMKGGIVYSNFVTTVSPRYADEIRLTDQGYGLQRTLNTHLTKFGGVLNGVNYDVWNPEIDSHIPHRYSVADFEGKIHDKKALRDRLMLRDHFKPIVAYVGRLDPQKGLDLVRHAIFYALANGAQFVLLGSGSSREIDDHFRGLKRHLNDNPDCHLEIGYDEELSHLIYAGADIMVVPSLFEPCGLAQLIAMKYGAVPVVRATGGLADTVFDANHANKPYEERTGFTFDRPDGPGLESALGRAIGLWNGFPGHFHDLRLNGMRQDYSWNHPGGHYQSIFEGIRAR